MANRLDRRRALGEHVQKAVAPSHVRSRLHNLVARDDINCYLDLDWVTYDDLELVVIFLMIVIKPCDTSMPKANFRLC